MWARHNDFWQAWAAAKQARTERAEEARTLLDRELKDLDEEEDMDSILKAMRTHADNPEVNAAMCSTVAKLTVGSDKNRILFAALGGIDTLVAAMDAHAEDSKVQRQAVLALRSLAFDNDNKTLVAAAGGITRILAAWRQHKCGAPSTSTKRPRSMVSSLNPSMPKTRVVPPAPSGQMEKVCCQALCNLAADNAENSTQIGMAGGIELVLEAMGTLRNHRRFQEVSQTRTHVHARAHIHAHSHERATSNCLTLARASGGWYSDRSMRSRRHATRWAASPSTTPRTRGGSRREAASAAL